MFDDNTRDELSLLLKFPDSALDGLKVHHDADYSLVEAAERLFDKGLITQRDGGYLTELGREAADTARLLSGLMLEGDK